MNNVIFKGMALMAFVIALGAMPEARAQDTTADDIETLFSAEEDARVNAPLEKKTSEQADAAPAPAPADKPIGEVKDLSDLVKLSPFEDVAVIQKRYLPKTKRFELFAGASGILNDAFFMSVGLMGRVGFYFSERYGLEANAWMLNTSEKQITSDLRMKRGVATESFISAESYYGLDFKWTPIYGKMAWNNKTITPFDLYLSAGGGVTGTNSGASEPTLHVGAGQIFALSKGRAFRWDFSWNFFSAESAVATSRGRSMYNNLFLTVGMSWFFPEATYR
ncbi:MAG: outer membrane beta-barrel domain-containing protein [Bdellovibrionaceae bacterium]|nr:outer membrane beta-barrel domain-containing protein [Pseudobdellovibrionaceae bacterium]